MKLDEIHESLVTSQRTQMAEQIDDYGTYYFWPDYRRYLMQRYTENSARFDYFTDACIAYNRIKSR